MSGAIRSHLAPPMLAALLTSSIAQKPLLRSRRATIAAAFFGPIPGSDSKSSLAAVFASSVSS